MKRELLAVARAAQARQEVRATLIQRMRKAREAGCTLAQIGGAAGLSRQRVHQFLTEPTEDERT
jgi:DNA-directed RNA polymerase sigma subunit (sigma70/sigma32)